MTFDLTRSSWVFFCISLCTFDLVAPALSAANLSLLGMTLDKVTRTRVLIFEHDTLPADKKHFSLNYSLREAIWNVPDATSSFPSQLNEEIMCPDSPS